MDYCLSTQGLTKRYRGVAALENLNMHVERGSIYGFVGKNGSGKTTLIRIICGLQDPTEGRFSLYGTPSDNPAVVKARRRLGAVVETPSLYPNMSAEENLLQQYRILGRPFSESVKRTLEDVGLLEAGKKKVKNFSLGMKQRLGIAIALAGDPDFLILDEPVNGLDPQGIIDVRELILKLNRERGTTVLISSHILDDLDRLATHYGFIDKGRLVREISAAELKHACRKRVRAEVSDVSVLARVLDADGVEYKILSDCEADVYSTVCVTPLVTKLSGAGCTVERLTEMDESLESYYVRLLGGNEND